jgi:hypothetical protein
MKKLLLLVLMLSVGFAWAQDNGVQTYEYETEGKIIVTAYMAGVAFSLDATLWEVGEVRPTEAFISPAFRLQNDGGVNIDVVFENTGDDLAIWTPLGTIVAYESWGDYPGTDEVYLKQLITEIGVGSDFGDFDYTTGLEEGTPQEEDLAIPAYVPTDADDGDARDVYILFVAPGSATDTDVHTFEITVTAQLAD